MAAHDRVLGLDVGVPEDGGGVHRGERRAGAPAAAARARRTPRPGSSTSCRRRTAGTRPCAGSSISAATPRTSRRCARRRRSSPFSASSTTISGCSSSNFWMNGWSSISPKRRPSARCASGVRCWSGRNTTWCSRRSGLERSAKPASSRSARSTPRSSAPRAPEMGWTSNPTVEGRRRWTRTAWRSWPAAYVERAASSDRLRLAAGPAVRRIRSRGAISGSSSSCCPRRAAEGGS